MLTFKSMSFLVSKKLLATVGFVSLVHLINPQYAVGQQKTGEQNPAQKTDVGKLSSGGKLKPVQANMDIRKYILNLDVDIANKFIKGNTTVNLQLKNSADTILLDLIQHYNIEAIKQ